MTTIIKAGLLNVDDIGQTIRFRLWDNNTEVATVVTAELRQISHNSAETYLNVGIGAGTQCTLDVDQPVSVSPPADHNDVITLAEYDKRA